MKKSGSFINFSESQFLPHVQKSPPESFAKLGITKDVLIFGEMS